VSIRVIDEMTVVADAGEDRVLILDQSGIVRRTIGSRGRGPGELLGVSHLALRHSTVFVGEARNGRVSEFTLDGAFVRTYPSPFAAGAVSAASVAILSASQSNDYYATLAAPDSLPVNALRRPVIDRFALQDRWIRLPGHDLIASDSLRTWVFDQGRGLLCEYDAPAGTPKCFTLPLNVLHRLRRYRDDRVASLEKRIRMRVEAAPLAKDLVIAGQLLALLLPLADLPILLINPTDGSLTPVMTFGESLPEWARSARSFAWDGSGFLLIGDDGFGRMDLSKFNSPSR
jgi:hypothetical protein